MKSGANNTNNRSSLLIQESIVIDERDLNIGKKMTK